VEWIVWVLVLGGGGFLAALLVCTPLVARGVRWWVPSLLGVVAFLAYIVFWAVWAQSCGPGCVRDPTGLVVLSRLQLFGWFAGTAAAGLLLKTTPPAVTTMAIIASAASARISQSEMTGERISASGVEFRL
jgi:hypothetical protein